MKLKVKRLPYERQMIAVMSVISIIFLGIGVYGTYYASPESKEFYVYYILITVASVIIGNIVVPLLQRPTSDLLIQETNRQIENLSKTMSSAHALGVSDITIDIPEIDWALLISESREIRLAFKSNIKWLNSHKEFLVDFLGKKNASIMVILPDMSIDHLCSQLAAQRKESGEHIKGDVEDAITILRELFNSAPGQVHLKIANTIFVSHLFIFSSKSIITIRTIDRWRSPHIICDGSDPGRSILYKFCCDQFDELWKNRSKQVSLNCLDLQSSSPNWGERQ